MFTKTIINEMYNPNTNSIVHLFGGGQCFIHTESRVTFFTK